MLVPKFMGIPTEIDRINILLLGMKLETMLCVINAVGQLMTKIIMMIVNDLRIFFVAMQRPKGVEGVHSTKRLTIHFLDKDPHRGIDDNHQNC